MQLRATDLCSCGHMAGLHVDDVGSCIRLGCSCAAFVPQPQRSRAQLQRLHVRLLAPSAVSLLGLGLGLAGLMAHDARRACALLMCSLAVDALDGACARLLHAATAAGARLDFAIDTALGGAIAAWSGHWALLAVPVAVQVATGGRYSGRALVTGAAVGGALVWT